MDQKLIARMVTIRAVLRLGAIWGATCGVAVLLCVLVFSLYSWEWVPLVVVSVACAGCLIGLFSGFWFGALAVHFPWSTSTRFRSGILGAISGVFGLLTILAVTVGFDGGSDVPPRIVYLALFVVSICLSASLGVASSMLASRVHGSSRWPDRGPWIGSAMLSGEEGDLGRGRQERLLHDVSPSLESGKTVDRKLE